jgi:Tetratricopeptide repeat
MTMWVGMLLVAVGGNGFNDTFQRGNAAYEAGDFPAAIRYYEQLTGEGVVHPAVFYNVGNAYYRAGRLAPAIANYERALALDPGLASAEHNLNQCLSATKRRLGRPLPPDWEQSLLFWHYGLGPRVTKRLALAFWLAFWLVVALAQWRRVRYLRRTAVVLGVAAVALGVSAWVKAYPDQLVVAAAPTLPVYFGTDTSGTVHFELYEGDRAVVDRRESGWARLTTATGEQGWAREDGLVSVGPPYEPPPEPGDPGRGTGSYDGTQ